MSNPRQRIGRWGEDTAAEYLSGRGYTILSRNVHTAHGEVDIVARLEDLLVFVEVKTRTSSTFGYPEESVTVRKQSHMLAAAEHYLQEHPENGENWQFDVIAVEGKPGGKPVITHFENVIA
jgi:putative endonuclease